MSAFFCNEIDEILKRREISFLTLSDFTYLYNRYIYRTYTLTMLLGQQNISYIIVLFTFLSSVLYSQQSLNSPGNPGRVLIGDLDITGNQITVEALIRRTGAGGPNIVSKHTDPSNVNYLLRPTTFELTTTNGFLLMNNPYTLQNNRWYHIAGTYDGSFVRYYVNGCLVVEQPWTGNLVTNDLQACIGNISTSPYGEGFVGQIDEVRIWNVARTEAQIKQNMVNLPNPATYPNLRAYYKFEGNYNNILGTGFNGTIAGNPAPSLITTPGDLPTEFIIVGVNATDNVICNGSATGSITVIPSVATGTTYSLNGGTYQGSNVYTGLTAGTYSIDVRSQEGCILSDIVTITDGAVLQASEDQTICVGETAQLNVSGGSGEYRWDANPGLSSTSVPNPTASPSVTTTYTVRSKVRVGQNLVMNGDFEMGNTGFTSGYIYSSTNFNQGNYYVTNDSPQLLNGGFADCSDHTSSNGYMFVADAACGGGPNGIPSNTTFWCQTINVTPNTDYEFSAWLTNLVSGTSSSLLFSINGVNVGNPAATSNNTCEWNEFFVTWNSGGATTATICIAEGTGVCSGNDFAVDDISFYELCELVDVVTITVDPLPVVNAGADLFGCENDVHTLSASGTAISYNWNNGVVNGLPFIAPVGMTTYTVTGTDINGCQNSDTLIIDIQQPPVISFIVQQDQYCYPVTVQFINTTTSVQNCLWILDNGDSIAGCTNASYILNQSGIYGVNLYAESINGCGAQLYQDSMIIIDSYPVASFTYSPESITLLNPEVKFSNTSSGAVSYVWNFGDESSDSYQVSPVHVYPDDKGRHYYASLIAISENGCRDTAIMTVRIKDELIFYIPNTFTPDGDQFNQTFTPVFTSGFDPFDYKLVIFNRWGEKVFESNNATIGWDGTYGGKLCQYGTYVWEIELKTLMSDERKSFVGHVNLLR